MSEPLQAEVGKGADPIPARSHTQLVKTLRGWRDRLLHWHLSRRIKRDWAARHAAVFAARAQRAPALAADVERAHLDFWAPLGPASVTTLRLCASVSGRVDVRIVPEELFAASIERCLSHLEWSAPLSHKSFTPLLLGREHFPETFLQGMEGRLCDAEWAPVRLSSLDSLVRRLDYPVVIKPNTGSSGGRGVAFPASPDLLLAEMASRRNFVVQRLIQQHKELRRFNPHGLNTVRVYTYRSVRTEETVVLNAALRMGRGGSLDNETAGGIVCFVHPDGRLNHFAVDKHARQFEEHPDTGIVFREAPPLPLVVELWGQARQLAEHLPLMRLAGWDFALDSEGRWCCLETNLAWHTIRFAQYAGHPFFGDLTEEVRDYCVLHPDAFRALWRVL